MRTNLTRTEILDLATEGLAHSYSICGRRDDVEAICEQLLVDDGRIVQLESDLAAVRADLQATADHLSVARGLGQTYTTQLTTERQESERLRRLLTERDSELDAANRLNLSFQAACYTMTGRTYDDLQREWAASDRAQAASVEREDARSCRRSSLLNRQTAVTRELVHRAEVEHEHRSQSLLFDVSDTDVVDEPVPGRCATTRMEVAS